MKLEGFDKYYEAPEPGRRERAYGWATAIGLHPSLPLHFLKSAF